MDSAATTEINGTVYAIGRLTPKKAFHVARRLVPFAGAILPHFRELFAREPNGLQPSPDKFAERGFELLPQIADVIARMPDADCDFVMDTCLEVVKVRQERGWAPVMIDGIMMFENIDLKTMLLLTKEVLQVNLGDFFPSSPPAVSDAMVSPITQ